MTKSLIQWFVYAAGLDGTPDWELLLYVAGEVSTACKPNLWRNTMKGWQAFMFYGDLYVQLTV